MQTITDISYISNIIESNSQSLPIEIEIGCGNGHFITEYKKTNHNILIGIDIKNKRCFKTIKKIKNQCLENIFIFRCKAEEFINNTPPTSIEKIHIYFPDPWPKRRHRKRRFFRMQQLDSMCACIKSNGSILFATDFFDYYMQVKVLLALHKDLTVCNSIPPKEIYNSVFAKRFTEVNKQIYFVHAEKK